MQHHRLRWRASINCLALGLVIAGLVNFFSPREYEASTSLYAAAAGAQSRPTDVYQGTLMVAARMSTYVQLADSPLVTSKVVEDLALEESPSELSSRIAVANPPDTALITITARDRDPAQAQRLAAAVASRFAETVRALETGNQTPAQVQFQVVQPAAAPARAVSPDQLVNLGYGSLIGGAIALLVLLWPFVRIASSATGQLSIVFLGPLADRLSRPSASTADLLTSSTSARSLTNEVKDV